MSVINAYKYELPTSGEFYNVLNSTVAPNFTFTQSDLYQALAQVYLFLDAVPKLDENNVLGIEYFNRNNNTLVYTDTPTNIKRTISEDRYINGLITDYQKGDLGRSIIYPSSKGFAITQSLSAGVPNSNDYVFKTDFPIREIEKVEIIINAFGFKDLSTGLDMFDVTTPTIIDITDYIYEYEQWILLEKPADDFIDTQHIKPTQKNTFYYHKGQNYIYVGNISQTTIGVQFFTYSRLVESVLRNMTGIYYTDIALNPNREFSIIDLLDNQTPYQVQYRITYKPILSGRLKVEGIINKYVGENRLDQNSGSVDLSRIGLNMFGTALKIGNAELVIVQKFSNFANRIKKGTLWIDSQNQKWLANIVTTTIFKNYVICRIVFTKNFNKLSSFIRLNQDKRFNEIDSTLTQTSEDIYSEYLYFSNGDLSSIANNIHLQMAVVYYGFVGTLAGLENPINIDYAVINTYNENEAGAKAINRYIPLVKYGSGNALCFEMKYESPITIGTQLIATSEWFGQSYYAQYVNYSDLQGFADIFDINFYASNDTASTTFASAFPIISQTTIDNSTYLGGFNKMHYYKKSNEIFALNYELILLPYNNEEIYFGEEFVKNNYIVTSLRKSNLKLYTSTSEKYDVLDKVGVGDLISSSIKVSFARTLSLTNLTTAFSMSVLGYTTSVDIVSYALCDQNNNILIAVNKNIVANSQLVLYVASSHTRL